MTADLGDRRALLQRQLDLAWSFAEAFVIDEIAEELAVWEPSDNACTVRRTPDGWVADWPDEENPPIPDVTIGWILWHLEWWWGDAVALARGGDTRPPEAVRWSGSTAGLVSAKEAWDEMLATVDLDHPVEGWMPEPQPLWVLAAWVNFELTKNLAEISHLKVLHANARDR